MDLTFPRTTHFCVLFVFIVVIQGAFGLSTTRKIVKDTRVIGDSKDVLVATGSGCKCVNYDCGCCAHLDMPSLHINDTGCVDLIYLPSPEYGIAVSFTLDGKVIFKGKVSARNPPPLCFGVPHFKEYASLCLRFYNLSADLQHFSGCVRVEARLKHIVTEDIELGCFHFGGKKDLLDWLEKEVMTNRIMDQKLP